MVGFVSGAWSPVFEIGKFVAFLSVCSQLAQIFTMPVSAKLCVSHGWPSAFYFHGIVSLIISIIFLSFFTNSPTKHPLIGEKELSLIMSEEKRKRTGKIPYSEILRSYPVWAIWAAFLGNAFGFQLIVQFMPTFLNKVLNVPIERTGFSAMVPPLAQIAIKTVAGVASDRITCFSEVNKLRLFNTLGMVGCGLCLVPLGYSPSDTSKATTFAIFFFTASISFLGLITCGSMKSATLVARQYAPFVMSVVQLVACIGMLIIPLLVAVLAPNNVLEEWRFDFIQFYLLIAISSYVFKIVILIIQCIIFTIYSQK
ncbi:hypothetical protein WR25_11749 isoform B [Diploscapter pachys]|uniref:Major facilitator superfamily (MFS) profile domain-containing protein n=1 Tax=Diploscapter pachys TaxID=2018661 RepID=A0A2A2KPF7_9BILA|nr:hypothetical protein WR25_11749 isoform B [Diploscapter pachys]